MEGREPSLLLGDEALVTDQVERVTDFERGFNQFGEGIGVLRTSS